MPWSLAINRVEIFQSHVQQPAGPTCSVLMSQSLFDEPLLATIDLTLHVLYFYYSSLLFFSHAHFL